MELVPKDCVLFDSHHEVADGFQNPLRQGGARGHRKDSRVDCMAFHAPMICLSDIPTMVIDTHLEDNLLHLVRSDLDGARCRSD